MLGIPLELAHLERVAIHVGQQPAGRLAVEARGGHQRVVLLHPLRPGRALQLRPLLPAIAWWIRAQVNPGWPLIFAHSNNLFTFSLTLTFSLTIRSRTAVNVSE